MENKEQRAPRVVDNSAFNDRFKFIFLVNDNIICERFFKINGFDYDAINSERMKDLFVGSGDLQYGTIISMIVNDLKSKSRVYTWYTTEKPVKLTGFIPGEEVTYAVYPEKVYEDEPKEGDAEESESEGVEPFGVTFKFAFMMAQKVTDNGFGRPVFSDYKSVYEAIWDGSVYPRFVRNSVDLTNSFGRTDRDINLMNFVQSLTYRMTCDKCDLVYNIIREICDAATYDDDEPLPSQRKQRVTSYLTYGKKKYPMSDFSKEYIDGWRKVVEKKTRDYYAGRI
ncbi:MAG: hypothetical protein J6X18_10085 [Bacteroidales bacterium]|nr:hypothetical protein [Bacteroidales bacterium]